MTVGYRWAAGSPSDLCAESYAWAEALGIRTAKPRWVVEVCLDIKDQPASQVYSSDRDTVVQLRVLHSEWRVLFVHAGAVSEVRVVGADRTVRGDRRWQKAASALRLADVGAFIGSLERQHGIQFRHALAHVQTNLAGAKAIVRSWLATLGTPPPTGKRPASSAARAPKRPRGPAAKR